MNLDEILEEHEREAILPEFQKAGKVHDWRNHVPHDLKMVWSRLQFETRCIIVCMAKEAADNEEWD